MAQAPGTPKGPHEAVVLPSADLFIQRLLHTTFAAAKVEHLTQLPTCYMSCT